ncbi:DUF6519 domain-containing protein [Streptomyces sp. NBC_00299]|uniref:DUF6519 domain-containing protein n=1 Tax=Streptomyces sp. NBC_00299 TaxID=2975705 RepID=UPI002E29BAA6|nr:DUF6519 domain-containing protein [Streptomyces sp. NBC_00299]
MTIRNDATRLTVRAQDERQPRSVVVRQGQVLLDADLDAQGRHLLDRVETETGDVLGSGGRLVVPAPSGAFSVTPAAAPGACGIGTGHGFLGGWLVENRTENCLVDNQPHPWTGTATTGPVLLALKALVRYVDSVEEPAYADPALGDAQAAGRALVDWQVFPYVPEGGWGTGPDCATVTEHGDWKKLVQPSTGTLTVVPDQAPPSSDPCSLTPQGGFSRPENLLYRIEVHGGVPNSDWPDADGPRFGMEGLTVKLSRRNASVLARVVTVDGTAVTVEPPALDPLNWFTAGAYAEFVSEHDDVDPRDAVQWQRLFQVARVTDTVVTLETAATALAGSIKSDTTGWFLRLWDAFPNGKGVAAAQASPDDPKLSLPLDLGDGLAVRLGRGGLDVFRRGDHWTFAARADGSVDWPEGRHERPHGPEIRYAPLAALTGPTTARDCRVHAATLTDRALLYRGGDCQEVPEPAGGGFVTLPGRLRVAVLRGRVPVPRAVVTWSMPAGGIPSQVGGSAVDGAKSFTSETDENGLCEVPWAVDASRADEDHHVQAVLTSPAGTPEGPPLLFTAGFRTAAATSYLPGGCELLQGSKTVQEALDVLCANMGGPVVPPTLRLESIDLVDHEGVWNLIQQGLIRNGTEVSHTAFVDGISLGISMPDPEMKLWTAAKPFDPLIEVHLELPYPVTDPDKVYWARASESDVLLTPNITAPFGFHRVRLDGTVKVTQTTGTARLQWTPSEMAGVFLDSAPQHQWGNKVVLDEVGQVQWQPAETVPPVLCLLRIRSAHIWAPDPDTGHRVYLNAEHLRVGGTSANRDLSLYERDPQRAADLDLFFYLKIV